MKLSEKLRKLGQPATGLSFKRAVGRALRPQPVKRFLSQINRAELERIQQTYGVPGSRDWPKYVDAGRFLKLNIRRAQDMGLDRLPPQRILDLGSGAGYFLFVTRLLGHSGIGLDIEGCPLFREMFELFELPRIIHRIEKFRPFPETGAKYDWITAFSISFNGHSKDNPWEVREWEYFLHDAARHLLPGGRIYLDLNPRPDGSFYSSEIRELFVRRGAIIDRRSKLLFPPESGKLRS
jgi:SAM-dependent methyltransferase